MKCELCEEREVEFKAFRYPPPYADWIKVCNRCVWLLALLLTNHELAENAIFLHPLETPQGEKSE